MRIGYIKLKNYRQYRDEKTTFTRPEANKNFTVIQGTTGAGKTNLLNAITWCLYGEEMHLEEKHKGLPIISTVVLKGLDFGETSEVEIEIQMVDEEDSKLIFRRALRFGKSNDGKINIIPDLQSSADGSKFEMLRQIERDMVSVTNPDFILARLIPKSLEKYFFFDGERLNDYFRKTSGEKIREEVFKISQLGLFEKAIQHLDDRRKDFLKQAGKLSPKAEEIKEKLDIYEKSLKRYKEELNSLKEEKREAEEKEEEYSGKLRTSSISNVVELEDERVRVEEELDRLKKGVEEFGKDRFNYLIGVAPLIFAYDPIIKTKKLVDKGEEAGDIPPDYKRIFLEKLLQSGICICGRDISEENECRRNIEKLRNECDAITDISDELMRENANFRSIIDDLKDFREKQIRYGKRVKELEEERKSKSVRLKEIDEKIGRCDVEKIKMWENKLMEYKNIKEELIGGIEVRKTRIVDAEKIISKLKRDIQKELEKEKTHEKIRKILTFCEMGLDAAKKIKDEIMGDVRKEIEERTKRQFFDLIWKRETYKDVKIDENYNLSVVHQSGMEGIGTLSAGERQVLALSFMAALNAVSGFNVPIIIDTPLGRLGKEPKKNIANNLPNYLKGKQVTLLVTEEEYTPEVRERLSERVGREYRIDFREIEEGGEAKVVSYEQ